MRETHYNAIAAYNATRIREEIRVAMEGLCGSSVVLLLTSPVNYQRVVLELMCYITGEKATPGVYVAINKPFMAMQKILEKEVDLNRLIFVDAITQTVSSRHAEKLEGCRYVASPENLTDLCEAVADAVHAISGRNKFVFFDSLSTLLLYNDATTVARFAHFLTGKIRSWGAGGVLLSLDGSSDALTMQLSQFCDAVIKIGSD